MTIAQMKMITMPDRGELWAFVRRHPFVSERTLCDLYGADVFRAMLAQSEPWLKRVHVKGVGTCYADAREPMSALMDRTRSELARRYALQVMGRGAALSSMAPGFEADGEFFWKEHWWRVWADPGGCAPEALRFIQTPPKDFGGDVSDIILTEDTARMDSLARQVERTWGGGKKVFVMHTAGNLNRIARPRGYGRNAKRWKPYGRDEVETHIRLRQRRSHKRSLLAGIAKGLDELDWALLVKAGNIPLMTRYELAYLQTEEASRLREILARLEALEGQGLLETADSPRARDRLEERKVLSSLALEMLAAYWGTSISSMMRMHPWPQVVDRVSRRPKYGLAWLRMFGDHYALVRKFALALVYGGRGVSNAIGEVQTRVVTTIGSRLLYRDHRRRGQEKQTGVVKPDGLVWVRINQRGWMDGAASASKPVCEHTLWLEVDRGTIPLKRLESKLDGYGSIWESLQEMNPALVWVIEGTPSREASILAMMRDRGVHGWTVLMERLVLAEEEPWWIQNAPGLTSKGSLKVGLKYEAIGGMAPWREIWNTVEGKGGQPLLGVQPWRKRELRRTPPRKGEQQSIKYKVG